MALIAAAILARAPCEVPSRDHKERDCDLSKGAANVSEVGSFVTALLGNHGEVEPQPERRKPNSARAEDYVLIVQTLILVKIDSLNRKLLLVFYLEGLFDSSISRGRWSCCFYQIGR